MPLRGKYKQSIIINYLKQTGMIKKRIRIGRSERLYSLVAFTLNTVNTVKLLQIESRRRISTYGKSDRV